MAGRIRQPLPGMRRLLERPGRSRAEFRITDRHM